MNAAIVFCLAVLAADTSNAVRAKVLYGTSPDQQHRADIEPWISDAVAKAGSPLAQPYTGWINLAGEDKELYSSMQGGRLIKGKAATKEGAYEIQISGFKISPLKQTTLLKPGEQRVVKVTDYPAPNNVFIALEAPIDEQAKQRPEDVKPEGPVYEKQGLALFFVPSQAAFTTGEPLALDVTLKNVSAKDFTLLTAPTLTDQWNLQISEAEGDKRYQVVRVRMRRLDVRPGPLVLKAGDASRFQLVVDDNHGYQLIGGEAGANSTVEHLPSGKYTLVASHTCHGATANRELAKLPPLWVGGIATKPVRLEIVDKAAMSGGDSAKEEPATLADADPAASPSGQEIPLTSIYSTNGQNGVNSMSATFVEQAGRAQYQEPYGYQLEQIHRDLRSGLSNVFLVRGKDITQAVKAARFAFGGGRSGERAIVEDADAQDAQLWAVAYFGVAGSTPPVWLIDSVAIRNDDTVEIVYHRNRDGGRTRDMHLYLAWIPLGRAAAGEYALRLIDADTKQVTLERRCVAAEE